MKPQDFFTTEKKLSLRPAWKLTVCNNHGVKVQKNYKAIRISRVWSGGLHIAEKGVHLLKGAQIHVGDQKYLMPIHTRVKEVCILLALSYLNLGACGHRKFDYWLMTHDFFC